MVDQTPCEIATAERGHSASAAPSRCGTACLKIEGTYAEPYNEKTFPGFMTPDWDAGLLYSLTDRYVTDGVLTNSALAVRVWNLYSMENIENTEVGNNAFANSGRTNVISPAVCVAAYDGTLVVQNRIAGPTLHQIVRIDPATMEITDTITGVNTDDIGQPLRVLTDPPLDYVVIQARGTGSTTRVEVFELEAAGQLAHHSLTGLPSFAFSGFFCRGAVEETHGDVWAQGFRTLSRVRVTDAAVISATVIETLENSFGFDDPALDDFEQAGIVYEPAENAVIAFYQDDEGAGDEAVAVKFIEGEGVVWTVRGLPLLPLVSPEPGLRTSFGHALVTDGRFSYATPGNVESNGDVADRGDLVVTIDTATGQIVREHEGWDTDPANSGVVAQQLYHGPTKSLVTMGVPNSNILFDDGIVNFYTVTMDRWLLCEQ